MELERLPPSYMMKTRSMDLKKIPHVGQDRHRMKRSLLVMVSYELFVHR